MAEEKKKVVVSASEEKLNKQIDEVLRTEAGRALWAHLARRMGFFETSLSRRTDGEVAQLSTECKEAQRLIYIELRRRPSRELLAVAEELAEAPIVVPPSKPEEERN